MNNLAAIPKILTWQVGSHEIRSLSVNDGSAELEFFGRTRRKSDLRLMNMACQKVRVLYAWQTDQCPRS